MAEWTLQHSTEIIDGPTYPVKAAHLIDNFNSLKSDIDDRLSKVTASAQTVTGAVTFSAAATFSLASTFTSGFNTNTISERTAASGVTIDSVRCKDGMVKIAGTPTEGGEIGYASNALTFHNGSAVITIPTTAGYAGYSARNSNTILAAADKGYLIDCTSTFTQTLTAAATLGSTWFCFIRNSGTGLITLDPNGAETIDGATTAYVFPGEAFTLVCDGSNFKTIGRAAPGEWIHVETLSPSGVSSVDDTFGFVAGYDHKWEVSNLDTASDAVGFDMRISLDGSAFRSTAGDYGWVQAIVTSGTPSSGANWSDTEITLADTAAGFNLGDAAGEPPHKFIVEGTRLDTADAKKFFQINGHMTRAVDGAGQTTWGHAFFDGTTGAILGVRFLSTVNFSATIYHYVRRRA